MQDTPPKFAPVRVADLAQNGANPFEIRPDSPTLKTLADHLGLNSLRKLRFTGEIRATGKTDWQLSAKLGASLVQPCVVTLKPVATRIDRVVKRRFLADWDEPGEEEVEMHADESIDRLASHIDLWAVMAEALALSLPLYPRIKSAELAQSNFTRPGEIPMSDRDARPFAGLAGLRDSLKKDG